MFCLKPKYILFLSKTNEKFNKKIFFFIEKKASKLKLVSSNKNEKKTANFPGFIFKILQWKKITSQKLTFVAVKAINKTLNVIFS